MPGPSSASRAFPMIFFISIFHFMLLIIISTTQVFPLGFLSSISFQALVHILRSKCPEMIYIETINYVLKPSISFETKLCHVVI